SARGVRTGAPAELRCGCAAALAVSGEGTRAARLEGPDRGARGDRTDGGVAARAGSGGRLMAELHPAARELLESDALVHLVTIDPDGSPQVSIVWAGVEGDEIVCGHLPFHRKLRNIQRDPR